MTPKDAKNAGLVACLVGVLVMVAAARRGGLPPWMAPVGVGVIVLGWGFFAWSILKNIAQARTRAKDENG